MDKAIILRLAIEHIGANSFGPNGAVYYHASFSELSRFAAGVASECARMMEQGATAEEVKVRFIE